MLRVASGADAAIHHHWVDIGAMAACMPLAAVGGEDQTFPSNYGFVWSAIWSALRHNAQGASVRGASTITQQTAKNLFLWPAQSYLRKAIEAYLTIWLDILWSKRRVLAVYLNVAQFDDRIFGVGAAAKRLFGVSPAQLSEAQCATLAAVLPAPDEYSAAHPGPYVRRRQVWILHQMHNLGRHYLGAVLAP
jgi:monofunctional biosynthetic peptidoglycan transglycosylase